MSASSIHIPLKVSRSHSTDHEDAPIDTVEIFLDELEEITASDIVHTLSVEDANASLYLEFAMAYLRVNKFDSYREILEAGKERADSGGNNNGQEPHQNDASDGDDAEGEKKAKMRIYCALAMIKVRLLSKGCAAGTNFADV